MREKMAFVHLVLNKISAMPVAVKIVDDRDQSSNDFEFEKVNVKPHPRNISELLIVPDDYGGKIEPKLKR